MTTERTGRWVTYVELAHLTGSTPEGARQLARRYSLKKMVPNDSRDRQVKVLVTDETLASIRRPDRADTQPDTNPDATPNARTSAVHLSKRTSGRTPPEQKPDAEVVKLRTELEAQRALLEATERQWAERHGELKAAHEREVDGLRAALAAALVKPDEAPSLLTTMRRWAARKLG